MRGMIVIHLGHVADLVQYPVKSMAGIATESAYLGWHGIAGDRRFAFRRIADTSGFPWLSASRLPELLQYHPFGLDESAGEPLPTHIRTPAGAHVELRSAELRREIAERFGSDVELLHLKHGIFDEAAVSVISLATIAGIGGAAGIELDRRRFRANIVLDTHDQTPFLDDRWVGGTLVFGAGEQGPAIRVTMRDARCMMINLDPDTARQDARILKTVVQLNANNAGVYATVVRTGAIRVGDPVRLVPDSGLITAEERRG
jgi:hypothetical protein